jgi:hypothetical protein
MGQRSFDPDAPGARLLADTGRHMLDWERTATVTFHTPVIGHFEPDAPQVYEEGERAAVPVQWARSLVDRGLASYEH